MTASVSLGALVRGLLLALAVAAGARAGAPNLLVVLADDLRFDALSANGNPHIRTPHLDALAARSVRFTQASVVMSLCSPSRAAILTGRYGSANGVTSLDAPLRAGETTVAERLRGAGYHTAMVGKWHIGGTPQKAGFDEAFYFRGNGPFHRRRVIDGERELRPEEHVDDVCVERSIAFLETQAGSGRPFFLMHATQLPHMDDRHAWPSPAEFRDRYDPAELPLPATAGGDLTGKPPYLATVRNRTQADSYGYRETARLREHLRDYYAVVTQLDTMIGRLLAALDRLGLRETTWIVFLSDNGWLLGEHRMTSKVLPYADSVRVPLTIAGPGAVPRVEERLALNLDLAPTLLELAGAARPAALHGASLLPLVRGGVASEWRRSFVYECLDGYGGTQPLLAAISPEWTLVHTWNAADAVGRQAPDFVELYNRVADPAESRNVADSAEATEVRRMLAAEIDAHIARHLRP